MNFSIKKIFGVFSFGVFLLSACSTFQNANQNQNTLTNQANNSAAAQTINDDVEELGKIVKLPVQPEEVTFREDNQTAPKTAKKLTAVLKYSASNTAQIVAQAEKHKPAAASEIEAENWFPAELVAQSQLSGDETLKGTVFAASDFMNPPYSDGKLTHVGDSDFFVLELTTP